MFRDLWRIFNDMRRMLSENRNIRLYVLVPYFYKNNSNYVLVARKKA